MERIGDDYIQIYSVMIIYRCPKFNAGLIILEW